MRINVYSQELTNEVVKIEKERREQFAAALEKMANFVRNAKPETGLD